MSSKLEAAIAEANQKFTAASNEIGQVIVGQKGVIKSLFIALLCDGHLLLEGLPGLAKTLIVKTLSKVIRCDCKRIQFTPDLLPADLLGTNIFNPKEGTFSINKGPIFTNILLADEINRAPAKVQSALLEVMQERQVTIAGQTFKAPSPYLVLATQNPIEHEGVYPLPEAQIDRFLMKVKLDYPSIEEEKLIMQRMGQVGVTPEAKTVLNAEDIIKARDLVNEIYIDDKVVDYILKIVFATRNAAGNIEGLLMYGASPRASLALKIAGKANAFLQGRSYVTPQDIKQIGHDVLRHRLRRSFEAEAEEVSSDAIIDTLYQTVPVP
jgi:MoxR-like ATPase